MYFKYSISITTKLFVLYIIVLYSIGVNTGGWVVATPQILG